MQTLSALTSFSFLPKLPYHKNAKPFGAKPCCSLGKQSRTYLWNTWPSVSLLLFGSGFFLGPLIDGLHSRVNIAVYQNGPFDIGPLTQISGFLEFQICFVSSMLLGSFLAWTILLHRGVASTLLGRQGFFKGARSKPGKTVISLMRIFPYGFYINLLQHRALVIFIELSAEMYKAGLADNIEAYILFAAAELIWLSLDRTRAGFTLVSVIGLYCPLAEIPIMKFFQLWYYPQANIEIFGQGLVTTMSICYFVYTPFLNNLSRWLKSILTAANTEDQSA